MIAPHILTAAVTSFAVLVVVIVFLPLGILGLAALAAAGDADEAAGRDDAHTSPPHSEDTPC